ncbi:DUF3916 domain-containing protein [Pseudohalocynthiibacter aestuariivivens]|uniref:DUF3916 domain-containing protein n=1 Tax=Roseovarius pelagicus TaxID=2980108 RepID=A0ABY6D6M2_9RHOB|nr:MULTISPECIES: DUF3916 domain-containing protein [Rhodobacterales]QIE46247.1 DUF3916 domain-containing protein [Pseudohalocynthiibacter aestuariivivens]UXX81786.1 DUF3916 domain-containing protein [Roseovarius pelagicus]
MRRLDMRPMKKLRGRARYERAFRRGMAGIAQDFPPEGCWRGDYYNWKLPVYEKVISPDHGSDAFRREAVQVMVDTAAQMAGHKPRGAEHARVAAIIEWPHLFGSEICVFFDRDYEFRFDPEQPTKHGCADYDMGWIKSRAPERDLLDMLQVAVPDGFSHAGIAFEEYQSEDDHTYAHERWVVMERSERIAA